MNRTRYFLSVMLLTLTTYFIEEIRIDQLAKAVEWQRVLYESIVLFAFAALLSLIFYVRCIYLGITRVLAFIPVAYIAVQRLFEINHRFQLSDDAPVRDILFFTHYVSAIVFFCVLVYLQFKPKSEKQRRKIWSGVRK